MGDFLTLKHSFNAGDLLTLLPSVKNLSKIEGKKFIIYQRLNAVAYYDHADNHPIQNDGINVCMNEYMFGMLKPLIEYQDYIQEFRIWQGEEVTFDIDTTRMSNIAPIGGGDIYYWPVLSHPQLMPDFSEPWIGAKELESHKKIILINRTERYRNPYIHYFFLKEYENDIRFVGTKREHELFNSEFSLSVIKWEVPDFRFLAASINSCRFFIGNQSMCYHIAEGTHTPRILEVCSQFPNTFPHSKDGYAFIFQNGLEYYFKKLLKETE